MFGKTLSYAKLKTIDLEILVNLVGDKERYLNSHMVLKSWDLRDFGLSKIDGVGILSFISRWVILDIV
ncbi:unnamed protein product [Camellia sinensis]